MRLKKRWGRRSPKLTDYLVFDHLISPVKFISESKSYMEFLSRVEKTDRLKGICADEEFIKSIRFIEYHLPLKRVYEFVILKYLLDNQTIDINRAKILLSKYLKKVYKETIEHSFRYLSFEFFDKGQISRYLKPAEYDGKKPLKVKRV